MRGVWVGAVLWSLIGGIVVKLASVDVYQEGEVWVVTLVIMTPLPYIDLVPNQIRQIGE